jgi:oxygen-independent coproporphyrinogen-3 oxidase
MKMMKMFGMGSDETESTETAPPKFIKTGKIPPVEESVSHNHYLILLEEMGKAGFVNYEFSNFGKEGYFSKNNTAYWQGKPYLGIGPSAHSFNGKERSWNVSNNIKYIKSISENSLPIEREMLSVTDRYNEYIMTGLRTMWGVSLQKVADNFGEKYVDYLLKQVEKPIGEGLIEILPIRNDKTLIITKKGKFLSDGIASNLFYV